jgi:hypothetical protein
MPKQAGTPFDCPHCAAKYRVIKIEATAAAVPDRQITCLSCGGPLHGRDGAFFLKYFLVDHPRKRRGTKTVAFVAPTSQCHLNFLHRHSPSQAPVALPGLFSSASPHDFAPHSKRCLDLPQSYSKLSYRTSPLGAYRVSCHRHGNIESTQMSAWTGRKRPSQTVSAKFFCRWRKFGCKLLRVQRSVETAAPRRWP